MGRVAAASLGCGASDEDDETVTILRETETQTQPSEILSPRERKRLPGAGGLKVRSIAVEQSDILVKSVEKLVEIVGMMSSAISKSVETNSNTPDTALKNEMRDAIQANTSSITELKEVMKEI